MCMDLVQWHPDIKDTISRRVYNIVQRVKSNAHVLTLSTYTHGTNRLVAVTKKLEIGYEVQTCTLCAQMQKCH